MEPTLVDNSDKTAHVHSHDDDHDHDHGNTNSKQNGWKSHWQLLTALAILFVMLLLEYGFAIQFTKLVSFSIFAVAFLLAGYNVLYIAYKKAIHFDFFNEFFLMSVATIGAFSIGSYSEGVAVMVFYSIGEWFQDAAVDNAKRSIKALLDIRPDKVTVIRDNKLISVSPSEVLINEIIDIKPGEKVALDGLLYSDTAAFNTAALTGESKPDQKHKGDPVYAGMINLNAASQIQVNTLFTDSKLSKILEMVQDATARKSQTQLFISRFAKIYTPIVFLLAVLVVFVPSILTANYVFSDWLYRGLVFLVISCPCALVVSIPLGYFGGIGLASKNGILFKGSNFLDVMTTINTVVMDKTGTLTKGVFLVQNIVTTGMDQNDLLNIVAALESKSSHPIAKAITDYANKERLHLNVVNENFQVNSLVEIPGHGLQGLVNGQDVLAGNVKLMKKFDISYDVSLDTEQESVVIVAINNSYAGYILIADELKDDALKAIKQMHNLNLKTIMLSGDKQSVVDKVAKLLEIDQAFGDLLPEDKVKKVQLLKDANLKIAFIGDGINDAPVVALADAGIAMGGLGSDATIETADIVIQNDQPTKIVTAIKIGKLTKNIVWQNITLALGVKIIVLILGAGGIATLWEAVIADVGVALLAILNAVRIQKLKL